MGLIFLAAILLYFALLFGAPALVSRYARKYNWSVGKRRLTATAVFLAVFLPMFWDSIPTLWAFSYYCDNYAGLTVNKSPEQWERENPGVAETLVRQSPPLQRGSAEKGYLQLNQRFRWTFENEDKLLTIVQREEKVVDSQTGEVLVRYVTFWTRHTIRGFKNLRDVKIWLNRNSCEPEGQMKTRSDFNRLAAAFENLGSAK